MKNAALIVLVVIVASGAAFLLLSPDRAAEGDVPTRRFFETKIDPAGAEFKEETEKVRSYRAALEIAPDDFDALFNFMAPSAGRASCALPRQMS